MLCLQRTPLFSTYLSLLQLPSSARLLPQNVSLHHFSDLYVLGVLELLSSSMSLTIEYCQTMGKDACCTLRCIVSSICTTIFVVDRQIGFCKSSLSLKNGGKIFQV